MRNILAQIKNIKWQYCINRKEPLLFRSLSHASHRYLKGVKGMPWQEEYSLHFDKRKKFYAAALLKGEAMILSGNGWEQKLKFLLRDEKRGEIKGTSAFKGKTKGRVKIVMDNSDLPKIKNGDIMVVTMTFLHFIPAMEKAGAFVTDEGGILCHAAIVAREMGKPCIIGTGNATKILKDGDLVEVDAERGIVKILRN